MKLLDNTKYSSFFGGLKDEMRSVFENKLPMKIIAEVNLSTIAMTLDTFFHIRNNYKQKVRMVIYEHD